MKFILMFLSYKKRKIKDLGEELFCEMAGVSGCCLEVLRI